MNQDNPDRLLAGKYKSVEELEKGYENSRSEMARIKESNAQTAARADALDRYTKQLEGALTQVQANPPQNQRKSVVDEEGRLDENALLGMIQAELRPIKDQLQSVPKMVQETLGGLLAPVQKQVAASSAFWGKDEVEQAKFTQGKMQKFLNENDGIRKVYEAILKDPDTANEAYDYAFSMWASTQPKGGSRIDGEKKMNAGQPAPSAGPTAMTPEDEGSWKRIQAYENQAAFTKDPAVIQAALGERFKGSKIMENLNKYAEEHGYKP